MATVAVIIPSFNHDRYIADALESVASQTHAPERIVVVDDGSTDRSVEVIRNVGNPRIELIVQENAGAHAAINRGIAAAGAVDYVAILNSDDLYEPERLARCVAYLEQRPTVELVCTGLRLIDDAGDFLPPDHPKARRLAAVWADPARDPAAWLGSSNFAKTTSNFVVRSAYAQTHPFQDYRYVHDYHFAIGAAMTGSYAVLPEPLLRYRTHTTNTIKRDGAFSVAREVLQMNFDLMRELSGTLMTSCEVRAAYTLYFRELSGNHADFRMEAFLALAARSITAADPDGLGVLLAELHPDSWPELTAPPSDAARRAVDQQRLGQFREAAALSRWLALGHIFGFTPNVFAGKEPRPDKELGRIKKEFDRSRWVRLGRKLGLLRYIPS